MKNIPTDMSVTVFWFVLILSVYQVKIDKAMMIEVGECFHGLNEQVL